MKQHNKIKLFRTLKVVFYCLGLPLFVLATIMLSTGFVNEWPFTGTLIGESEMFAATQITLTGSALYGVWVALGVWVVIALFQLIAHRAVKNRRSRMLLVVCISLVAMLAPVFAMDFVFEKKLDSLAASAAANGVTVDSYKSQLSYYRSHTSDIGTADGLVESGTDEFIAAVENVLRVYNIGYQNTYKDGTAGNMANTPVTYADLGEEYDGNTALIKVAPKGATMKKGVPVEGTGYLEVDGQRYDGYFWVMRTVNEKNIYLWYRTIMMPSVTDGIYGEASYNYNGLLSDGFIFGIDSALRVLEDYYSSKAALEAQIKKSSVVDDDGKAISSIDGLRAYFKQEALDRQEEYYLSNENEELVRLWEQDEEISENFTLTAGEVNNLLASVATMLGNSTLMDYVFTFLSSFKFEDGVSLRSLLGEGSASVADTIMGLFGATDLYLFISYQTPEKDYLYVALRKDTVDGELLLELSMNEDFSLDSLSNVLNSLIGSLGLSGDTVGTILSLLGMFGLDIDSGYILNENGDIEIDITKILVKLVETYYWYQSPVIKPYYMFYEDESLDEDDPYRLVQQQLVIYDTAYYEGAVYGKMIGSVLIGDSVGDGSYSSDMGLADLTAVKQLQTDLSYKGIYYPLFSVRDMLATFAGVVVFCLFLSYICAEKELEWATGTATEKPKKVKKDKKGKKDKAEAETDGDSAKPEASDVFAADAEHEIFGAPSQSETAADTVLSIPAQSEAAEDAALNVSAKSDKEVK